MCGIPRWAILHSMWGRVQDAHSQHSKTHTTQQDHDNWTHTTGYVTHSTQLKTVLAHISYIQLSTIIPIQKLDTATHDALYQH